MCSLNLFPSVGNDIATVLVDFKVKRIKHIELAYILMTSYMNS